MADAMVGLSSNAEKPDQIGCTTSAGYVRKQVHPSEPILAERSEGTITATNDTSISEDQLSGFTVSQLEAYMHEMEASRNQHLSNLDTLTTRIADLQQVLTEMESAQSYAVQLVKARERRKADYALYLELCKGRVEKIPALQLLHIKMGILAYNFDAKCSNVDQLVKDIEHLLSQHRGENAIN